MNASQGIRNVILCFHSPSGKKVITRKNGKRSSPSKSITNWVKDKFQKKQVQLKQPLPRIMRREVRLAWDKETEDLLPEKGTEDPYQLEL